MDTWKLTQVELRTIWERRRVEHRLVPIATEPRPGTPLPSLDPVRAARGCAVPFQ